MNVAFADRVDSVLERMIIVFRSGICSGRFLQVVLDSSQHSVHFILAEYTERFLVTGHLVHPNANTYVVNIHLGTVIGQKKHFWEEV